MFNKPNAIVYIRRSSLVVAGKNLAPARLSFPAELMHNLEVLRFQAFVDGCRKFFASHDLKGRRVLVVLDPSIVFNKSIEFDTTGRPESLANAFISAIPFDKGKRACVRQQTTDSLQLYATNADIYTGVQQALMQSAVAKVIAITPASAYDLSATNGKLAAAIEIFVADTKVRQQVDFVRAKAL